ncbi:MAG: NAD-dependent epimerase/dehydratase family protein [Acidobacteriota bacterium]|nr:NAD-dependent epimerase/dehydratase family protein [Acidobacteriota bacterium]
MLLLTGATGYLGSAIARELIARRLPFRVLVRQANRLGFDPATGQCEVVLGDLRDREALRPALQGVDAVIHTAALVKMWVRDRNDFFRVNVEGLQNLLQAAEEAGVQRIVYTSSFLALGPSADVNAGEGLHHNGLYSDTYAESKTRALDWLRGEEGRRFPVIVMFPGVIYGPGPRTEGNLVGGMIDQYLAGNFPGLLGSGNQRWSFAFISDVVNAHLAAIEKGKPGEEYVLGGDNRSLNDFFHTLADFTHVQRRVRHLPIAIGKIVGATEVMRARAFGHSPQLTPGVVEIFKHDWVYSSARAVRELGYWVSPLEEGLMKTLAERRPPVIRQWPSTASR